MTCPRNKPPPRALEGAPSKPRPADNPKGDDQLMNTLNLRQQASKLVLAIALATGTAMIAGHIVPDAAHAQRKKKKDKEGEAPKADYSKEWTEAFVPVDEQLNAPGTDLASLLPKIDQILALSKTPDEQLQTGQLIYNIGVKLGQSATDDAGKNTAMVQRLRGMDMMIESGRVPIDAVGSYNYTAFQLASVLEQHAKARTYLQRAIDVNYSSEQATPADLIVAMAQNHFETDEYARGLDYLGQAIEAKTAAGQTVEEQLYQVGFSVAYRNDLRPQVYDWAIVRAQKFPTPVNWRDAVNVVRQLNEYDQQPTLDLLRLSRMAGVLDSKQDLIIYLETADARRLPQEVKDVVNQLNAAGSLDLSDTYIVEQYCLADRRLADDRKELPIIEKEGMAPDASLLRVVGAGKALLNYSEYERAAPFFERALTIPGADTGEVLTLLGLTQVGMADYAAAKETFAKITGEREPIARVWLGYVKALEDGTALRANYDRSTMTELKCNRDGDGFQ